MILVPDPRPPDHRYFRVTAEDFRKHEVVLVSGGPFSVPRPFVRYHVLQDAEGNTLEMSVVDLHTHFELRPKLGVV